MFPSLNIVIFYTIVIINLQLVFNSKNNPEGKKNVEARILERKDSIKVVKVMTFGKSAIVEEAVWKYCEVGKYAAGWAVRVDPYHVFNPLDPSTDNRGLNGLEMYCREKGGDQDEDDYEEIVQGGRGSNSDFIDAGGLVFGIDLLSDVTPAFGVDNFGLIDIVTYIKPENGERFEKTFDLGNYGPIKQRGARLLGPLYCPEDMLMCGAGGTHAYMFYGNASADQLNRILPFQDELGMVNIGIACCPDPTAKTTVGPTTPPTTIKTTTPPTTIITTTPPTTIKTTTPPTTIKATTPPTTIKTTTPPTTIKTTRPPTPITPATPPTGIKPSTPPTGIRPSTPPPSPPISPPITGAANGSWCNVTDCRIEMNCKTYMVCQRVDPTGNPDNQDGILIYTTCPRDHFPVAVNVTNSEPGNIFVVSCIPWGALTSERKRQILEDEVCAYCDLIPVGDCTSQFVFRNATGDTGPTQSCPDNMIMDSRQRSCVEPCEATDELLVKCKASGKCTQ